MRGGISALLLIGIGIIGCQGGGESSKHGGGSQPEIRVEKYRIGKTVASDGSATMETDTYSPGDSIYMSFEVKGVPSGSPVQIAFSALPDNRKMAELQAKTTKNGFVSYHLSGTRWPAGQYRVEYFLLTGPKPTSLGVHDFKLVAPLAATPEAGRQ